MSINWGLVGPGRIAGKFARAMQAEGVGTLKAVASRNADRCREFADEHQIETAYDDYAKLYEDDSLDAIYIATPHNFHLEQALAAIACGKHLLVEKPLTVTAADSERLFAAAKAKGVFVMEAMWSLFLPAYQQANTWLARESVGEISGVRSSFGFVVPRKPHDRLLNPDLAGGVLLDMGIYTVATSQWFMQADPEDIVSQVHLGPTGVDETCAIQLHYPGARVSQLLCSFRNKYDNALTVFGSKGRIVIPSNFWQAKKIKLVANDDSVQTVDCPFEVNGFEYQIRHVVRCIAEGKSESNLMTHERTLASQRIMDQVRRDAGLLTGD
ncbi:Gfo/Idh/MocA family oxidoreductase [Marinobacter sp. ATCH36]|uniref:Gfo/Idh/MocA family protein n=1 Tax=Marinobacter sp. ATCH36 TaxID=2945106 RepID=UPI00201FECD7|nr:Gfo/Idh/MocA family oxidoreductase [Marinobacter sp. ATCH36]MCL7945445.1 Gfo/Idh/MocA family oxidoreductase [Marinobacter sp. ATCH36]